MRYEAALRYLGIEPSMGPPRGMSPSNNNGLDCIIAGEPMRDQNAMGTVLAVGLGLLVLYLVVSKIPASSDPFNLSAAGSAIR